MDKKFKLKYTINGCKFQRTFNTERERNDYAVILANNGIVSSPPCPLSAGRRYGDELPENDFYEGDSPDY